MNSTAPRRPPKLIRTIKMWRYHLMRNLGRVPNGRPLTRGMARLLTVGRAAPPTQPTSVFENIDERAVVDTLQRDGVYLGLTLPATVREQIQTWTAATPCFGDGALTNGFRYADKAAAEHAAGKKFATGFYYNTLLDCDAIRRLSNDPTIVSIATKYLGVTPMFKNASMWWSFAGAFSDAQKSHFAQKYHYDLDDFVFVKFFFYLSDVDESGGPHRMVRGTHERKHWRHSLYRRRWEDEEVRAEYDPGDFLVITGPQGFGFIEDTHCLHKGTPPIARDRLVLEFEYGSFQYPGETDERDRSAMKSLIASPIAP